MAKEKKKKCWFWPLGMAVPPLRATRGGSATSMAKEKKKKKEKKEEKEEEEDLALATQWPNPLKS